MRGNWNERDTVIVSKWRNINGGARIFIFKVCMYYVCSSIYKYEKLISKLMNSVNSYQFVVVVRMNVCKISRLLRFIADAVVRHFQPHGLNIVKT